MGDDLESRLQSHARAFEGLLSLIPAKDYYGKQETNSFDTLHQKQSKEERRAARRAKLDPASHRSAKDVMDENARKRKREAEGESPSSSDDSSSDIELDIEKEKPLEGLKVASQKQKKQKTQHPEVDDTTQPQSNGAREDAAAIREKAKVDKKKQKADKKKEKLSKTQEKQELESLQQNFQALNDDSHNADEDLDDDGIEDLDVDGLVEEQPVSTTATNSHASSSPVASAVSSSSSTVPPAEKPQKPVKVSKVDPIQRAAFQARLTAKLEAMRAARKADGPDGRPARNRAELIESRRKKEAERRAARKMGRQVAKEDEERFRAEEQLAMVRGSASPLFPYRSTPENEPNLSFGRVAWKDGQQLQSGLSGFLDAKNKKGKSDIKTALLAAEKKKARINALDETKRKEIEEKDMWLDAKKRVQGEKVHNDPTLLKKSVKRQEKAKTKSSEEWNDRKLNVEKGKAMRQKKRETNLQKRKDEKGNKGKGKGKKVSKPAKKVKRPGFEGTFRGR